MGTKVLRIRFISRFLIGMARVKVVEPKEWVLGEILAAKSNAKASQALEAALEKIGLGEDACISEKAKLLVASAEALNALDSATDSGPSSTSPPRVGAFWVPGRLEVAGKHTDYAGGRSLLCAVPRGFLALVRKREDQNCRVVTLDPSIPLDDRVVHISVSSEEEREVGSSGGASPSSSAAVVAGHWSKYVRVALKRLARNFPSGLQGMDLALTADLPSASGMSTSSALVCLVFLALDYANSCTTSTKAASGGGMLGLRGRPEFLRAIPDQSSLCEYLGCLENGKSHGSLVGDGVGVGTFGGSEDHTAIMCSDVNTLKVYSFCPTLYESGHSFCHSNFGESFVFVIGVSGVLAEKTKNANATYNSASAQAAACARRLGCATLGEALKLHGGLAACKAALRQGAFHCQVDDSESSAAAAGDTSELLRGGALVSMLQRLEQFSTESEKIVPGLAEAISDHGGLCPWTCGELSGLSQRYSDAYLGNIVEETRWLPSRARELGACAASAFGAGFGGSVWALVDLKHGLERGSKGLPPITTGEAFAANWRRDYVKAFPENAERASFFAMLPAPGACRI
jgi:galactokinase